jgi:hypothetical protein
MSVAHAKLDPAAAAALRSPPAAKNDKPANNPKRPPTRPLGPPTPRARLRLLLGYMRSTFRLSAAGACTRPIRDAAKVMRKVK